MLYLLYSTFIPNFMKIEIISKKQAHVEIINSIKHKHKDLRQLSKGATFACTYGGTPYTLIKNLGFSKETAQNIYDRYHELYKESDAWVNDKIVQASECGYVTCAFGLRLRTHRIKQTILGNKFTPKEAEAERRTAANALGQSWCMLTSRAGIEFNSLVRNSEYRFSILPVASVHDAQYFLIKNDIDILLWANKYLVKAISWQEDPIIADDKVKLKGELSVFYPSWADEFVVPNNINKDELLSLVQDYIKNLGTKK